jgi:DNA-binding response OmpR family regulator
MPRILIVDDEKSIRLTLRAFLQDGGYEAGTADDATQAQALLCKDAFDVVVTDIVLPGVSGVELLKAIRAAAPAVQVIMMTGEPSVETAAEAVHAGASDYLTKPVGKNAILRSVANAIRLKAYDDERRKFIDTLASRSAEMEDLARRRKMLLHLLRHDIANAVSGAIALLERKKTTIEQFSVSERAILAMLVHCEGVIQDVRAREMESLTVSGPQAATLRTLVEETCTVLGAQAGAKGVTIAADINPDIRVRVRPGPFVVHVLNNILRNAIKFSYPGGVIKVGAKAEDAAVSVVFRDSGCGIPQSRLGDLFDKPSSTVGTAGEVGTGYGLRHVRECLLEIGGSIDIESVCRADDGTGPMESGTTITIRVTRAIE